jgi:acyl-CoA synthetase (AMP-forming)/AMP-acid ligase II
VKKHPEVVDAYIYPVHDDKMFQRAYAAVVLQPKSRITEQDLKNYILQQLKGKDSFLAMIIMSDFRPVTMKLPFSLIIPMSSVLYHPVLSQH